MKEKEGRRLSTLYIRYALEKTTSIVLALSIIILLVVLIFVANPFLDDEIYLLASRDIHFNYLRQGLFVIEIFNSLIIALLAQSFAITSISFDSLFISYTRRNKICFSKLIAGFTIILFLIIIEALIYLAIPTIMYHKFKLNLEMLYLPLYLILRCLIELNLSIFLTTMIRSFIVPLSIAFISASLNIVMEGLDKVRRVLGYIIPVINFSNYKISIDGLFLSFLWIIALIIFYVAAYNGRDLKENL